jgi:ParB family chromosome partitioning protein
MTDTNTPDNETPSDSGHPESGTLEHIDPHELVLDTNVRDEADLDAEFIASIKEHGVLIPIAARRTDDGQLRVRAGQRRTLAAREAALPTVPVYIRSASDGDDTAQLLERLTEQIVENDQRRELTTTQRAKGIQQMLDAGVSVTKVATALSVHKDTVKAAGTAGTSRAAMQALSTDQLSLTEAAALAEFDDVPDALDRLVRVAGTQWFDHTVSQLREQQASLQALRQAETPWREEGFTVLDSFPHAWDVECVELGYLRTAAGEEADEAAVSDPALWAVMLNEEDGLIDVETGEPVKDDAVDWSTRDDPEAVPAEGLRHADTVKEVTLFVPEYYCIDYAAAGLVLDDRFKRYAGLGHTGEKFSHTVDLDDDEDGSAVREAAKAHAELETQRRQRRKVIALNKLGEAAAVVRRRFLATLVSRKTPPKGAGIFVADSLARDAHLLVEHHGQGVTAAILGLQPTSGQEGPAIRNLVTGLPANGDARAHVVILATVLGALESRTPKDAWRQPAPIRDITETRWGWETRMTSGDLLRHLATNGYTLSPIEQVITGDRQADEVYDEYLADTTGAANDEADEEANDAA